MCPANHKISTLALMLGLALASLTTGCDSTANLSAEEHIQRAKGFQSQNNLKTAIIELKNAVAKSPDNAQARLLLGESYVKTGQGESAEKELQRAQALGLSKEIIIPLMGEALIQQRAYQPVLDRINAEPQFSASNRARIDSLRADALLGLGKIDAGCALYSQAHNLDNKNLIAYHGLAACAWVKGDQAGAQQWLEQALKLSPKDDATLRLLAQRKLEQGQLDEAATYLERAVNAGSPSIATRTRLGVVRLMQNRIAEARQQAKAIRSQIPKHPDADYLEAFAYYLENKKSEALSAIQTALKTGGNVPDYLMLQATLQLDTGALEQAQQTLSRVLSEQPGHVAARKLRAFAALTLDQPIESRKLLQPLLQAAATDSGTYLLAGKTEAMQRNWGEAERLQRLALQRQPDNSAALLDLGEALAHQGKTDEAIQAIEQAGKQGGNTELAELAVITSLLQAGEAEPALARALTLLRTTSGSAPAILAARAQLTLGRTKEAIATLESVAPKLQDITPLHPMLAALYIQQKRYKDAEVLWQNVLRQHPKRVEPLLALSDLALAQNQPGSADKWLDRAAGVSADAPAVATRLATRHINQGEPSKAINVLRSALQSHPENAALLGTLGNIQLASSDPVNARTYLERAARLEPANPRWQLGLAQVELADSRPEKARSQLEKLIADRPGFFPAYDNLITTLMRMNRPAEARKIAQRAQAAFPKQAETYLLEGDILLALKAWDEASIPLERAMQLAPTGQTLVKLHKARSRNGTLPKADALLDDWLARFPNDTRVRLARAELNLARLRFDAAINDYTTVLKTAPSQTDALNNLAFLLQEREPDKALNYAQQAYKLASGNPNIQDTYGWLLARHKRDFARALPLLKSAAERVPGEFGYRIHYIEALVMAGQRAEARKELQILLVQKSPVAQREAGRLKKLIETQ